MDDWSWVDDRELSGHKSRMDASKKRIALELESKKKLLTFLRDNAGHYSYGDTNAFLEQDTALFGEVGSKLRERSQQFVYDVKRNFLKRGSTNRKGFNELLGRHGIDPTPDFSDPSESQGLLPGEQVFQTNFLNNPPAARASTTTAPPSTPAPSTPAPPSTTPAPAPRPFSPFHPTFSFTPSMASPFASPPLAAAAAPTSARKSDIPSGVVSGSSLNEAMLMNYFRSIETNIDIDRIESCEHDIYVISGTRVDIKNGKFQAKVITIIKPVHFFPEVLDLEAELWSNRAGVFIKAPSVPSVLYNSPEKVVKAMAGAYDVLTEPCKATLKVYKTEATRIKTDDRNKFKIISVAFPKGVTCNNREFNPEAEGDCELVAHYATLTGTHPSFKEGRKLLEFPFSFGFWRIVFDGSMKQAEVTGTPSKQNSVAKLMEGVKHLNLHATGKEDVMEDGELERERQHQREIADLKNLMAKKSDDEHQDYLRRMEDLKEAKRQVEAAKDKQERELKEKAECRLKQEQAKIEQQQQKIRFHEQELARKEEEMKRQFENQKMNSASEQNAYFQSLFEKRDAEMKLLLQKQLDEEVAKLKNQFQQEERNLHEQAQAREKELLAQAQAKAAELNQKEQLLRQQAHEQSEELKRKENELKTEKEHAEGIRRYANEIIQKANDAETKKRPMPSTPPPSTPPRTRRAKAAAAAAATKPMPTDIVVHNSMLPGGPHSIPMDDHFYAIHPHTKQGLSHEEIEELIVEFSTRKDQPIEEVLEWIQQMGPSDDQEVVDLLFANAND